MHKNLKQWALCLLLLLLLLLPLTAAAFEETARIKIPFGKSSQQIGIDKGGGEHWKPLFFSIDPDGRIHIPDFYKNRIAIFTSAGKLAAALSCLEGLSPRMNFFALTPLGSYVTYSDSTLYLLNSNGSLVWKKFLGYGVIPSSLIANEVAIFLVPAGGRTIVFDYFSSTPLGVLGYNRNGCEFPLIISSTQAQFSPSGMEMAFLPTNSYPAGAFGMPGNPALIHLAADSCSIWKAPGNNSSETYFLFSPTGRLLFRGNLIIPATGTSANGFWTTFDRELQLYKNLFYEDYMEIVVYKLIP